MRFYKILISENAIADLESIYRYVSNVIGEPEIAEKLYAKLKNAILELDFMPSKHQCVDYEPLKSLGIRRKPVGKYLIYYSVIESVSTVLIMAVNNSSTSKNRE